MALIPFITDLAFLGQWKDFADFLESLNGEGVAYVVTKGSRATAPERKGGQIGLLGIPGEPGRDRTYDQLVKSQLLYH